MRYFLAWVGCGLLGVIVDLIRHRKEVKCECAAGGYWTTTEVVFLIVISVLLGPWLLVLPLMRRGIK